MFGLATEDFIRVYVGAKIDVLTKRIDEALTEVARAKHVPVMTPKPEPKPVELYTAKVWIADRQGTEMSYKGVLSVSRGNGYDNSDVLRLYGADGKCKAELTGGYSYSLTEQKPEGVEVMTSKELHEVYRDIAVLTDRMAVMSDAVNHRVDMLETWRRGLEKSAMDTAKAGVRKAMNKPQPKGAKR